MVTEEMNWQRAETHLKFIKKEYASIGMSGNPALVFNIIPLEQRLAKGERTKGLYEEIIELE